jgi:hypothetical protein
VLGLAKLVLNDREYAELARKIGSAQRRDALAGAPLAQVEKQPP